MIQVQALPDAAARPLPGASTPEPPPARHGPGGLRYDFNEGCRVLVPAGDWRVRLRDLDTGCVLFDAPLQGGLVTSTKKFHVRFGIEAWRDGVPVFEHRFDPAGQDVLLRMELGGIGDQIAWIGHAAAFAKAHGCRVTCCVRPALIPLLSAAGPGVSLLPAAEIDPARFYATYKVLIFYDDRENVWSPCDYRQVGLCNVAAYILGLPPSERRPAIAMEAGGPPMAEPYVCIATQATSQNKHWNNPSGWRDVVGFLRAHGYRVVCIDKEQAHRHAPEWNHLAHGAEDLTGDRPLTERARWLHHAAFFVGLSSGLSWLAWAAGCPVVLVSGFTHPLNEFATPHRVINWHACNGCANDVRHRLDPADFLWCPRQGGTARQFECTRLITAAAVIDAIRGVPGFAGTASPEAIADGT